MTTTPPAEALNEVSDLLANDTASRLFGVSRSTLEPIAALSRALDPALAERAGEVLEGVTPGPWRTHAVDDTAIISSDGTDVGTTCDSAKAERDDAYNNNYEQMEADARFIAWCREGVPALMAQNAALRANTVQALDEADREYSRKTNDLIERHAEQLAALRAELDYASKEWITHMKQAAKEQDRAGKAEAKVSALQAEIVALKEREEKLRGALQIARVHVANNAEGWSVSRGAARDDLTIVDAALALTTEADNG